MGRLAEESGEWFIESTEHGVPSGATIGEVSQNGRRGDGARITSRRAG